MNRYFAPPTFGDREKDERARVLFAGVWLITVGILLFAGVQIAATNSWARFDIRSAPIAVTLPPLALISLELNRRGYSRAAGWLFILGYVVGTCFRAPFSDGVRAPSVGMFPVMAMFAGMLLGPVAGILTAIGFAALDGILAILEWGGILHLSPVRYPPVVYWAAQCLYMAVTLFLLRTAVHRTDAALRLAESELKSRLSAERRLALALEAGAIGTFESDFEADYITVDETAARILGVERRSEDRVARTLVRARLHPDDLSILLEGVAALNDGASRWTCEYRVVDSDGSVRHVASAATVFQDEAGGRIQVGTLLDVTERHHREAALNERVKELTLLHSATLLLQEEHTSIADLLQRWVAMLPAGCQHADSCEARVTYDGIEAHTAGWRASPWRLSAPLRTSGGQGLIEVAYTEPKPDADHGPFLEEERAMLDSLAEMLSAYLDREHVEGQRDTLEVKLTKAEQMRSMGTLAGGIAHDFNNLLGAIQGFSRMLEEDLPPGSAQHRFANRITAATERGKAIVEQILSFARQGAQARTVVELGRFIREAESLLESLVGEHVTLDVTCRDPDLYASINGGQMTQVLANLCKNASDAFESRPGRVNVELFRVAPGGAGELAEAPPGRAVQVVGTLSDDGDYACIRVSDDGPGIAPATLQRIFDPFYTTKERSGGTGLGLAVVHGAVESYGGACVVQSELGHGTAFSLLLPLAPAEVPVAIPAEVVATGSGRVMVVDDQRDLSEVLVAGLERRGYEAVGFNDARAALAAFEKAPGAWRMLITDQIMPELHGSDLARAAKSLRPHLPVVLYSGFDDEAAADADLFDLRLPKPMDIDEMVGRLAALPDPADTA